MHLSMLSCCQKSAPSPQGHPELRTICHVFQSVNIHELLPFVFELLNQDFVVKSILNSVFHRIDKTLTNYQSLTALAVLNKNLNSKFIRCMLMNSSRHTQVARRKLMINDPPLSGLSPPPPPFPIINVPPLTGK